MAGSGVGSSTQSKAPFPSLCFICCLSSGNNCYLCTRGQGPGTPLAHPLASPSPSQVFHFNCWDILQFMMYVCVCL